jgi:GNAT superfamily N-acetyltransferase
MDPVAVISVFAESVPEEPSSAAAELSSLGVRFRKFACNPDFQGRGIGTILLEYVMAITRDEFKVDVLWCDARLVTARWYQKRGFARFGSTFFKGEVEYVRMKTDV